MVKTAEIDIENCKVSSHESIQTVCLILTYIACIAMPFIFRSSNLPIVLKVLTPMAINGVYIIMYFYMYLVQFGECAIFEDPLNQKLFDVTFPEKLKQYNFAVSHWPFTHFVFFLVLAYCFPSQWYLILFIGVTWEVIESLLKTLTNKNNNASNTTKSKRVRINADTIEYTTYWDSSFKDIIFNTIGAICGLTLYHFAPMEINLKSYTMFFILMVPISLLYMKQKNVLARKNKK